MPHYGILREYRFEDANDVRGAEMYGVNDEKLGTLEDVVFDHSSGEIRYVVLKTGGLFSRKKVMVPAGRIEPYGNHEDKFYVDLDKDRLEMLPEFNEDTLKSEQDWSVYEKEHEKRWSEGAVLYDKETGRIITPPPDQVEGARRGPLSEQAKESLNRDFTPQRMGHQDDYLGVASGSGKTTLQPQKASIAGKDDVAAGNQQQPVREVMSPVGSEIEIPVEAPPPPIQETLREPGIYRVERQPPAEQRSGSIDPTGSTHGLRWSGFQESLRSRRDKIVVECPLCGSQEKVA
jgi:sporulation protein YlmC with PRC-barrel domain